MREALTKLLYDRYSILFAEHRLDASESGMAWGFQHDDGWFAIVDALAAVLTAHRPDAVAVSVKQKMGRFVLYLKERDTFSDGACFAAGSFSRAISELSGRPGVLMSRRGGGLRTLAAGELPDYAPVPPLVWDRYGDGPIDRIADAGLTPSAMAGERAFHDVMALRVDPVTGACGPVDDCGRLIEGM